ncbi:hypothetical protein AC579_9766 [Pseudocercospora musae]|uniref:Uncharacterized protein n=1 Tax=Pseudocercospora musae TaxID=113226 RepID=A0A139IG43_9PEZI|nr:hypothetical protein AC579_9766 [Pseudocercospora musae]KXT13626.1 hypothetical protein AC579_9766 [Pseudocercospora musae]
MLWSLVVPPVVKRVIQNLGRVHRKQGRNSGGLVLLLGLLSACLHDSRPTFLQTMGTGGSYPVRGLAGSQTSGKGGRSGSSSSSSNDAGALEQRTGGTKASLGSTQFLECSMEGFKNTLTGA